MKSPRQSAGINGWVWFTVRIARLKSRLDYLALDEQLFHRSFTGTPGGETEQVEEPPPFRRVDRAFHPR